MRSKALSGLLALIGAIALFATMVEAGGAAGAPVQFSSWFMCHNITGGDPDATVDIYTDELGVSPWLGVRVRSGSLGCSQVRVLTPGSPAPTPGVFPAAGEIDAPSGIYLKCYAVSVPKAAGVGAGIGSFLATDYFEPTGEALLATQVQFLCGTGNFTQN